MKENQQSCGNTTGLLGFRLRLQPVAVTKHILPNPHFVTDP